MVSQSEEAPKLASRKALIQCNRCSAEFAFEYGGVVKVLPDGCRDFQPFHAQYVCPKCNQRMTPVWKKWLGEAKEL